MCLLNWISSSPLPLSCAALLACFAASHQQRNEMCLCFHSSWAAPCVFRWSWERTVFSCCQFCLGFLFCYFVCWCSVVFICSFLSHRYIVLLCGAPLVHSHHWAVRISYSKHTIARILSHFAVGIGIAIPFVWTERTSIHRLCSSYSSCLC